MALGAVSSVVMSVLAFGAPVQADVGEVRFDHPRASDAGKVSAGGSHTCAILTDGSLWCWGRNDRGQLGLGDTTDRSSPTRVGTATNWRSVSTSANSFTCAVSTGNSVFCWGFNADGQTGVSSGTSSVTSPTQVASLGTTVESVSVGASNSCVVTTSNAVRCWGTNTYGQLGTAVTIGQATHIPTAINNLSGTFTSVSVGDFGVCAMKSDRSIHCWGSDLWGQRGNDATQTADNAAPTQISSANTAAALISGPNSNCMIAELSSGVLCWGQNENNYLRTQSGNIMTVSLATAAPFQVNSSNVSARGFSIGSNFACLLKNSDASIVCGGTNSLPVIGTTGQVSHAPSGTGFLMVTTGTSHACAIRSDRRLVCWGHNAYGKVGIGSVTTSATATVISFGAHPIQTAGLDPVAPSAPATLTTTATYRAIDASWTTPSSVGTAFISSYEYRLSTNSGTSWGNWTSFASTNTSQRISGLTAGTSYLVEVRAVSSDGTSTATRAATAVTPTSGCNPLRDCVLGAVGPNGGTIVIDEGPGTVWGRFIEAAPVTWFVGSSDPVGDWNTQMNRGSNWKWGSVLPTKDEIVRITNAYNANPTLLAGWGISDADDYWTSTTDWNNPIDDGLGNITYPAYAGTVLRDPGWWYSARPIIALDGPTALSAPTVTVTASELSLSVSWTTPTGGSGGTPTDIETRLSDNGGSTWGSWTSRGVVNSIEISNLTAGRSYRVQVRGVNFAGNGASGQSAVTTMTSSVSPSTQSVNGVVNTAITDTTALSPFNFNGAVTYAVTSGSLPAGLSLNVNTGVISGTPTATSSATITVTATGATAGTATSTVTFSITDPPPGGLQGVWAIDGLDAVVLDWFAPSTGPTPTGYQYAYSTDGGTTYSSFTPFTHTFTTTDGSFRRVTGQVSSGLVRGTETIFKVRAMNGTTPGAAFPDPSGIEWATWAPRATAKISDACDPMNDCDVGDVGPGGGVIVFDNGSNASWGRYIESAPAFWNGTSGDPSAVFGCTGSTISSIATTAARALGAGRNNTAAILAGCSQTGIAARLADAYSSTVNNVTFDDWHLPSSDELNRVFTYRQSLGGWKYSVVTSDDRMYASSTDSNNDYFFGIGGSKFKAFSAHVRPVRYVMGPSAPSAPSVIASTSNGRIDLAWTAPTNDGGNAVSGYQYRVSSDDGVTWNTWTSAGLVTSLSLTSLTNGAVHRVEVRALNRGGNGTPSAVHALVPGGVAINVTEGASWTPVTPFASTGSMSGATFAVTNGALPAGLLLNTATGEITGTPTASGTFNVEMTATVGGASVSTTVTFSIAAAPTTTTSSTTLPPATSVVSGAPRTTQTDQTSTNSAGASSNVTMTAEPGKALIRVNGSLVNASVLQASERLRSTVPEERTTSDVDDLRRLANTMLDIVRNSLGAGVALPVSIVNTSSGAVLVGLVVDPITGRSVRVPIEHVVLVHGGGIVLMVSGDDGRTPAKIGADGVLEISRGGSVSVLAYGLEAGANGEVVVMSTPLRIDTFTVDAQGGVSSHARFPASLPFGSHTVVVTVGNDAASLGFRIVRDSSRLPVTGFSLNGLLWISLVLLAFGLVLLNLRLQHVVANSDLGTHGQFLGRDVINSELVRAHSDMNVATWKPPWNEYVHPRPSGASREHRITRSPKI